MYETSTNSISSLNAQSVSLCAAVFNSRTLRSPLSQALRGYISSATGRANDRSTLSAICNSFQVAAAFAADIVRCCRRGRSASSPPQAEAACVAAVLGCFLRAQVKHGELERPSLSAVVQRARQALSSVVQGANRDAPSLGAETPAKRGRIGADDLGTHRLTTTRQDTTWHCIWMISTNLHHVQTAPQTSA